MSKNKQKTRRNPPVEIRPHQDNRTLIDEIIAEDVKLLHIEQMTEGAFWMGVYFNNSEKRLTMWFEVGDEIMDDGKLTRQLKIKAAIENC